MIPVTDMPTRALGRLAYQYAESTNLRAVVSLLVAEAEAIYAQVQPALTQVRNQQV